MCLSRSQTTRLRESATRINFYPQDILGRLLVHVESHYPSESCGMILQSADSKNYQVRFCRNIQDEMHREDPHAFPRTSRHAYFMDPEELLQIHREIRESGNAVHAIFHSHIDAEAVFSAEDRRMAVFGEEPLYPEINYLILSLRKGLLSDIRSYAWNPHLRDFEESSK